MESFSSLTITIFPSFNKKTIEIIQRNLISDIAISPQTILTYLLSNKCYLI